MRGVTCAKGVAVASAAAGPLFIAPPFVASVLWGPGDFTNKVLLFTLALFFSVPFGFIASILPNLLATSLLAWLGRENVGVRFWPFWALAGAGLGWTIDWLVVLTSGSDVPGPLFALAGLPCALICRWGTRWSD